MQEVYQPDAHLIGSNTIEAGIELYEDEVPVEEERISGSLKEVAVFHTGLYLILEES